MIAKIPDITLVLSKDSFREEFNTYRELVEFVLSDITEVSNQLRQEWDSSDLPLTVKSDEQSFKDYCFDWLEDFLGEHNFTVERIAK